MMIYKLETTEEEIYCDSYEMLMAVVEAEVDGMTFDAEFVELRITLVEMTQEDYLAIPEEADWHG